MKLKKYIWMFVAGIILLAIDIRVPVGQVYPEMKLEEELGKELQLNTINNYIGEQPTVDIMSDILAFLLIFLACALMIRTNRRFLIPLLLAPLAIILIIAIPQFPYHYEMGDLYLKTIGFKFLLGILEIVIEFFIIRIILDMAESVQNEWYTNEMLFFWIFAMINKGFMIGIEFFFGRKIFYNILRTALIVATIVYLNRLYVVLKNYFIQEEEKKAEEEKQVENHEGT